MQYADYALWQRELLGHEDDPDSLISEQIAYWRGQLADLPENLRLPGSRPSGTGGEYHGATLVVPYRPGRPTAAWPTWPPPPAPACTCRPGRARRPALTRLGCGTDIPLGTPVAGRTDSALDDLIGDFLNTLVLRTDTSGNPTWHELLGRISETNLGAYANQDVPIERLVELLNPDRSAGRAAAVPGPAVAARNTAGTGVPPALAARPEPVERSCRTSSTSPSTSARRRRGRWPGRSGRNGRVLDRPVRRGGTSSG
ncbi:hypothetical protein GCM10017687_31200 [Streptomyces echinatus]|uniref:condensation domain-containing protein n=1 Tax=Streptomyces echinatus TaxID=67293 RepID=UPI0031EB4D51